MARFLLSQLSHPISPLRLRTLSECKLYDNKGRSRLKVYIIIMYIREVRRDAIDSGVIRNRSFVDSSPTKGSRCFIEQHTFTYLLSTSWFHEL